MDRPTPFFRARGVRSKKPRRLEPKPSFNFFINNTHLCGSLCCGPWLHSLHIDQASRRCGWGESSTLERHTHPSQMSLALVEARRSTEPGRLAQSVPNFRYRNSLNQCQSYKTVLAHERVLLESRARPVLNSHQKYTYFHQS